MRNYRVLLILWSVFILVVTLLPGEDIPDGFFTSLPYFDKLAHGGLFLVYAFLLRGFFSKYFFSHFSSSKIFLITLLIALTYGILIECIQLFVPHRNFEFSDILADFIGTITGLFIFQIKLYFFS